jgi:hypothetical protein
MGLASKNWTLRSSSEVLVGRIQRIYVDGGIGGDGDTNIDIVPNRPYLNLLSNRLGTRNAKGTITCEINLTGRHQSRGRYNEWVQSLAGSDVTARGVYVDDLKHEDTTELHPLDLILGRVSSSLSGKGDWIRRLAVQRGLTPNLDLYAYRFAAASDNRGGFFRNGPPLDEDTRTVGLSIEFPPQPEPRWTLVTEQRLEYCKRATSDISDVRDHREGAPSSRIVSVNVTCQSKASVGPGMVLGEVVAYWRPPRAGRFGAPKPPRDHRQ